MISDHLGLATVTFRGFHTSYAIKSVLEGSIPSWCLAENMGHFNGNPNLLQKVYHPTYGPVDTRRTAVSAGCIDAFSENVKRVMSSNGAIMQLLDPQWQNNLTGRTLFLVHGVNAHKLPILHCGDGLVVEEIRDNKQDKLGHLLPYVPTTVAAMGKVKIQHPKVNFNGFNIQQLYNYFQIKATQESQMVIHTKKVLLACKSQNRAQERQRYREGTSGEELAEYCARGSAINKKTYKKRKASMMEEKEAARAKKRVYNREHLKEKSKDPKYKKQKSEGDRAYKARKKAEKDQAALSSSRHGERLHDR